VHTAASHDSEATPTEIVEAAVQAGLDAIAITDHNTGDAIDEFLAIDDLPIAVFPGVELTTSEGAHLLVLFDRTATSSTVANFLGRCHVDAAAFGTKEARSPLSYEQCLKLAHECQGLCIAAHADLFSADGTPAAGLLQVLGRGNGLRAVLDSEHLHAVELCTVDDARRIQLCHSPCGRIERRPALRGSDAHRATDVGRESTWIKMTAPTLEGLRLAFTDGQRSIARHDGSSPNDRRPRQWIERIEVSNAKLLGRHAPFAVAFSPWLNAIIGGRSTGKSSVVAMLRLALCRGDDLPEELAQEFRRFAKVGGGDEPGMLLNDTKLVVIYCKDGVRFRLTWHQDATTIEQQESEGSWRAVEGNVAQRFPASIFSQKQVFSLADGSEALLRVIDASPSVRIQEWREEYEACRTRYLSERAKVRAIESQLADRGRLQGELDDVIRKVRVFEDGNHKSVLQEYSRRQAQYTAVEALDNHFTETVDVLRRAADEITSDFDDEPFNSGDAADRDFVAALREEQRTLQDIQQQLLSLATEVNGKAAAWLEARTRATWLNVVERAREAYARLEQHLDEEEAGTPGEYPTLLTERQRVEDTLRTLSAKSAELARAKQQADETLERLLALRRELTRRRTAFVTSVLDGNTLVKIDVVPYGDRAEAESSLRHILGTTSFSNDLVGDSERPGIVHRLFADLNDSDSSQMEERLQAARAHLTSVAQGQAGDVPIRDQRFAAHLRQLTGEAKDLLAAWAPRDSVRVRVSRRSGGRRFLPAEQASPGSKSAGMLAFLLAHGDDPIVLDQPEDDLDNRLINSVVVEQLRSSKPHRQLIVVTHNPNIVVNGDAEFVASMDLPDYLGQIVIREKGGLQQAHVREEICAVMEGGRTAFEQRYRRISGWRKST